MPASLAFAAAEKNRAPSAATASTAWAMMPSWNIGSAKNSTSSLMMSAPQARSAVMFSANVASSGNAEAKSNDAPGARSCTTSPMPAPSSRPLRGPGSSTTIDGGRSPVACGAAPVRVRRHPSPTSVPPCRLVMESDSRPTRIPVPSTPNWVVTASMSSTPRTWLSTEPTDVCPP